jgi:uncharacterized linocin/CFP29 family protein
LTVEDLLRRSLAPLTPEGWEEIDENAVRVLKSHLSARTLVDFSGPHGWAYSALNLGRLKIEKGYEAGGVPWGLREVQPLIEVRMPFELDQLELDNVARGSQDADLEPLENVARKVAAFEEGAVYHGYNDARIRGILPTAHKPLKFSADPKKQAHTVAEGIRLLEESGIDGPYALVLGSDPYYALLGAGESGYPPKRIITDILGGPITWSPVLEGGVLLSLRGGDFELVVGQDLSIGFISNTGEKIKLFLTESFTFRVLEPAAAVELKLD